MASFFARLGICTAAPANTTAPYRVKKFVDLLDKSVRSRPFAIVCPDGQLQRAVAQLWLFRDFGALKALLPAAPSPLAKEQDTSALLTGNRIRAAGWVTYNRRSPHGATHLPNLHFHVARPEDVLCTTFAVSPLHFAGSAMYRPELSPPHETYTGASAIDALALAFMSRGSSPASLTPTPTELAAHDLYGTGSVVFDAGNNRERQNAFVNLHFSGDEWPRNLY